MNKNNIQKNSTINSTDEGEKQLVVFKLQKEEFGIYIERIKEIVRVPEITHLPKAPEFLWGISNLRGDIMPIIDTRKRFSMPETKLSERARVLVVEIDGTYSGLVVDEVNEVMRVPKSSIDNPPAAVKGIDKHFLEGIVKVDGGKRVIMTLNLEEIILAHDSKKSSSSSLQYTGSTVGSGNESIVDEEQIISLKISNEEYAFPISKVREILRFTEVTEVPNVPTYVKGIITVRNNLLPILDMRTLLGKPSWNEEISQVLISKKQKCKSWINNVGLAVKGNNHFCAKLSEDKCELGKWLNSANEFLGIAIDSLKDFKACHDNLHKSANTSIDLINSSTDEALRYYNDYTLSINSSLDEHFNRFISSLNAALREEQRIFVIETNGVTVGLLVDTVNEVIRVPRKSIEDVTVIGSSNSKDLRGVANLDNGKRLIMLIDESSLICKDDIQLLEEINKKREINELNSPSNTKGQNVNEDVELIENLDAQQTSINQPEQANISDLDIELDEEQLVTFSMGDEEFGLRITDVQEINRLSEITKLPKAPHFVEGVTNLRGDVVPVIDLRKRFGMSPNERDDRTRIIISDIGGRKTGLIVDKVNEVMRIPRKDIENADEIVTGMIDTEFVDGIGKSKDKDSMIILLNIENILTKTEKKELANLGKEKNKTAKKTRKTKMKTAKTGKSK